MISPLDQQLLDAAETGDFEKAESLVSQGADINADGGLPLIWAAHKGHVPIVEILLAAGADRTLKNKEKTAEEWARGSSHSDLADRIRDYRGNPDQVILHRRMSDQALEDIYDFKELERISLLRSKDDVKPFERKSFIDIQSSPSLRKAFNEHVRRGGETPEETVFLHTISKPTGRL